MSFAYGVDVSLMTQLEKIGWNWVDDAGAPEDPFYLLKQKGANAVRFRVFVNPSPSAEWTKKDGTTCYLGFCDNEGLLQSCQRAKTAGLNVMVDFHYSDFFADPQYQETPEAWKNASFDKLCDLMKTHTKETLSLLKQHGITPEWVQVGNEINTGMMHPFGSMKEHPDQLAILMNTGYDAVKDVLPDCLVVTHLTALHKPQYVEPFLDSFFGRAGKTDVLGFSHYPYWFNLMGTSSGEKVERSAEYLHKFLAQYREKYGKPVMICEIGDEDKEEEVSYKLLTETIKALKMIPNQQGLGAFYWEPEVCAEILPDHYPLGAAKHIGDHHIQFTKALNAYRDNKEKEET